jgi:hypothetical protein
MNDDLTNELNNPNTLPERLVEIEHHLWNEDCGRCHKIVRHPNCPPELFIQLAQTFPDAATANPAWELLMIEGVMGRLFPKLDLFFALLEKERISPKWMLLLENHPNPRIVQALKQHIRVAGIVETKNDDWQTDLADLLVRDLKQDSRLAELKKYNALPDWVNQRLSHPLSRLSDSTPKLRGYRECPVYPEIPPSKEEWAIAEQWVATSDRQCRSNKQLIKNTRSSELLRFFAQNIDMRDATIKADDINDPFADDPYCDGVEDLLAILANPATPEEVIQTLSAQFAQAKNLDSYEISLLLQCKRVPYDIRSLHLGGNLETCSNFQSRTQIYRTFKDDPDATERVRREAMLYCFSETKEELSSCLALMQVESPTILKRKATAAHWHLRLSVALNPLTLHKTLKRYSTDGNRYIRAVAQKRLASPYWRFTPQ